MMPELKAEPLTTSQLDHWLAGERSRRILVVPFGGPIPSPHNKAGMDVDGEFFHEGTDLYGPFPALRASRERLVDWHHDQDPTGTMKGAIIGRVIFDAAPETVDLEGIPAAGIWGDFWANAGEKRRALVALLERRGVPLFGSTQAVKGASVVNHTTGSIDVWPIARHTISTSPQNTFALVPALKAVLDADPAEMSVGALRAFLTALDAFGPDLRPTFQQGGLPFPDGGADAVKAGRVLSAKNEAAIRAACDGLTSVLDQLMADMGPAAT